MCLQLGTQVEMGIHWRKEDIEAKMTMPAKMFRALPTFLLVSNLRFANCCRRGGNRDGVNRENSK